MERKRTRTARGEPASKKRKSTPPEAPTQPQAVPLPVNEPLPSSIAVGKPLPTLPEPQPENLPKNEYKSVSESGVLAESLQRSRARWLSEGIFERYWTKPTAKKKKESHEMANNPPKESMTKLGTCTITVEPHVFEASMWSIRDPTPKAAVISAQQQPMYRPIMQYGPPGATLAPPVLSKATVASPQQSSAAPTQQAQVTPVNAQNPASNGNSVPSTTNGVVNPQQTNGTNSSNNSIPNIQSSSQPASQAPSQPTSQPAAQPISQPITQPLAQPASQPTSQPNVPPPAAAKSTDPVIQMLAERAATDPSLKALMRIVANGEATPFELKRFQTHIDELTRLHKHRQETGQMPSTPVQNLQPVKVAPKAPFQAPPQPQALRSKGPVPPTKSDIAGIVFEFTGGSGDRFLFPKYSILEYLPHGQVIASFLIVRKGSSSDSPGYDPELDYYQPVTIRLWAHQGRQLEALQKVVASQDEVRQYMDDIMDNMTRAEYVLLAMRLPRDAAPEPEKEVINTGLNHPEGPVLWGKTNPSPPPSQVKPIKKVLTEGEQYQNFIATVGEKTVY